MNIVVLIIDLIVAFIWFMIFKFEYGSITTDSCRAIADWIVEGDVQDGNIYGVRLIVLLGFLIPNVLLLMGSCAGGCKLVITMCVSFLANAIWVVIFLYTFVAYLVFWLW